MKKYLAAMAVLIASIGMNQSSAAVGSANFNVTATLSSACTVNTANALNFGSYTAHSATAVTASADESFNCTRGLTGVTADFGTGAATAPTSTGLLSNGLQYTMSTAVATASGTAATASGGGSADIVTYTISGTIPAGQAGTCTGSSCGGTQARTLTLNF